MILRTSWEVNQNGMGCIASERLSFTRLGKAFRGKPRSKPESGNPTFRDCRGARGNVTLSAITWCARLGSIPTLSQPYSTHFSKLILVTQQEYLLAFEDGGQEMTLARKFRPEFGDGIYGRVDGATGALFYRSEARKHVVKRGLPNDHQVDIALCRFFLGCHGPVNKCQQDSFRQRVQL